MSVKWLVFETEEEAYTRADVEGARRGYLYHSGDLNGSRFYTSPKQTLDNKYALNVSEYELTEEEESTTVSTVTFPGEDD